MMLSLSVATCFCYMVFGSTISLC